MTKSALLQIMDLNEISDEDVTELLNNVFKGKSPQQGESDLKEAEDYFIQSFLNDLEKDAELKELISRVYRLRKVIPTAVAIKYGLLAPTPLYGQITERAINDLRHIATTTTESAPINSIKEILKMTGGVKVPSDTSQIRQLGRETMQKRLFPNILTEIRKVKPQHEDRAIEIAKSILTKIQTSQPTIGTKVDLARKFMNLKNLQK